MPDGKIAPSTNKYHQGPVLMEMPLKDKEHYDRLIDRTNASKESIPLFIKDPSGDLRIISSHNKKIDDIKKGFSLVYIGKPLQEEFQECLSFQVQSQDVAYYSCLVRSGILSSAILSGTRIRDIIDRNDISPRLLESECRYQCNFKTFSTACCSKVNAMRKCKATASKAIECKQLLEDIVGDAYECGKWNVCN